MPARRGELAPGDPGDIGQIVEQTLDLRRLRRDGLQAAPGMGGLQIQRMQDLAAGHDGRERIAQLVTQGGQELIALGDVLGALLRISGSLLKSPRPPMSLAENTSPSN